ncbi:MAG: adenylosuccinate synthase [Gemmataceae bacterium]
MACACVVGLQWGDEAKGKIVDLISEQFDYVVRYNGGANAGHTIVRDNQTFKLSLLPTGILRPNLTAVIGNGVVVSPSRLLEEITQLRSAGIDIGSNLAVSNHAHVIFPYHMAEESLSEASEQSPIGTTGRGIGPCYQDKVGRFGAIRIIDLMDHKRLLKRLEEIVPRKNKVLQALAAAGQVKQFSAEKLADDYAGYGEQLRPFVTDTVHLLHGALKSGRNILFEAAQGSLLDVDHGTYPYVTSSNSSPAGIWSGSGVPARRLNRVVGVVKAYCTRVGRGPFPSELDDGPQGIGERIRKVGKEYGTVTGRPRRVGWFDAVATRYSLALGGADELAIMLLDVLSGLPEINICVAYQAPDGSRLDYFPADPVLLGQCKPILETCAGWQEDLSQMTRLEQLPSAARTYIDRLQTILECRSGFISVGPDRHQTITA